MSLPLDLLALARAAAARPKSKAATDALAATGSAPAAVAALLDMGPGGRHAAAALCGRGAGPLPAPLHPAGRILVADPAVPVPLRLAVAGRLLDAVPDDPAAVRPVVAAVVAGLSRVRAAERLRQLQRFVEGCRTLDTLADAADAAAVVACPRCRTRGPRRGIVTHLWTRHRLVYADGKAVEPRDLLDPVVTAAAAGADAADVFLWTQTYYPDVAPRQVLQAVTARGADDPAAVGLLAEAAADAGAGLCPACLSPVADPVPPVPPPATWAAGRVAADGFVVAVTDRSRGRGVTYSRPGLPDEADAATSRRVSPRWLGTLAGLPVVAAGAVGAAVAPGSAAVVAALAGAAAGGGVYALVRAGWAGVPDADQEALRLAWDRLTPGVGRSPAAVRFLARLCRLSVGVGDPAGRAERVSELVAHAAVLADRGPGQATLLAAARLLQAADGAAMGRERVAGYLDLFAPVWRGELGLAYAEAAAELVLTDGLLAPGDTARLGVLVLAQAFAAGVPPGDVRLVARFAPWLGRLLPASPAGALAAVYRMKSTAAATTVFDLAAADPDRARARLLRVPDLLMDVRVPDGAALGPVAVTAAGVVIGTATVADPAARLACVRGGAGWVVEFGPHRVGVRGEVQTAALAAVRGWLRFRADTIAPADELPVGPPHPVTLRLLAGRVIACPLCRAESLTRAGKVGVSWDAVRG